MSDPLFRPPQPLLWENLTRGMIVGHVWYTPMLGLEGEIVRINELKESVLIKFWGDSYLQGTDEWSRQEVEKVIFYLGTDRSSYFLDRPADPPGFDLDLNLLKGRGEIAVPSWIDV